MTTVLPKPYELPPSAKVTQAQTAVEKVTGFGKDAINMFE